MAEYTTRHQKKFQDCIEYNRKKCGMEAKISDSRDKELHGMNKLPDGSKLCV